MRNNSIMDREKGSKSLQFMAVIAGNLCIMTAGTMIAWTSPVLPILTETPTNPNNPLGYPILSEEGSWMASLLSVGAALGSFLAGWLAQRWGRRVTLLLSIIPYIVSWILIATATSVGHLYAGRFIAGMGLAFPFTVVPMYCGEIAETSIRGILGSFVQLFMTIGLLYVYCIGPYVSYTTFWIACAVVPFVFFGAFFPMPESPYFLAAKGRHEDVVNVLVRLRSKSAKEVLAEAEDIRASVEEACRHQSSIIDLFTVKANFKALLMACALAAFQGFTGINVIFFYSEIIFNSAGKSAISPPVETIIVGLVQLTGACVTPLVVDRLGRKILLIVSGIGSAISMGTLGLFFYLKDAVQADVSGIEWLPVASLIVFIATYSIGWGPLPWTMMGELFALDIKSKASGIAVFVCWFVVFVTVRGFTYVVDAFGEFSVFWIFAGFSGVSVLFTAIVLPETKGKSLEEIQAELGGWRNPEKILRT